MSVNQIDLIRAICKYLDRHGVKTLNARQHNAIVAGANTIMDALQKPHQTATPGMGLDAWLKCDETGVSSIHLAGVLSRQFSRLPGHPHDADDFGRCLGLLMACPELREHLGRMASEGPEWTALVGRWDELDGLLATDREAANRIIRELVEGGQ